MFWRISLSAWCRGLGDSHEADAQHDGDGNLGADGQLEAPEDGQRQDDDGDVDDHVEDDRGELVDDDVAARAVGLGVPALGDGAAAGEEDAEEGDEVGDADALEDPGPAPEGADGEEARVEPEDGELDGDGAEEPGREGCYDELGRSVASLEVAGQGTDFVLDADFPIVEVQGVFPQTVEDGPDGDTTEREGIHLANKVSQSSSKT